MRGSRIPNPVIIGATIVAAMLSPAVSPRAADYDPAAPTLGPPVVLFSPNANTPAPTMPAVRSPVAAAAAPAKRPPATMPAKLGPPPDPQPALSLETDLQPVGPSASAPATNPPAPPPTTKSPAG